MTLADTTTAENGNNSRLEMSIHISSIALALIHIANTKNIKLVFLISVLAVVDKFGLPHPSPYAIIGWN